MISLTDDYAHQADGTSTERATKAAAQSVSHEGEAVPKQRAESLPTNGELDGEFYFEKVISGSGEIPEAVHQDSYNEVIRMAEAAGWLTTGDVYVAEQRSLGDRWSVFYAVPVRPNGEATPTEDQTQE
jgi:hypothetical protein